MNKSYPMGMPDMHKINALKKLIWKDNVNAQHYIKKY